MELLIENPQLTSSLHDMLLHNLHAHKHIAKGGGDARRAAPARLSSAVCRPGRLPRHVMMRASTTDEDMQHRPLDTVDADEERQRSESPSPMGTNASEQARKLTNTSVAVFSAQPVGAGGTRCNSVLGVWREWERVPGYSGCNLSSSRSESGLRCRSVVPYAPCS
eukprot:33067-Pelagomonas_calceolata.AAC.4